MDNVIPLQDYRASKATAAQSAPGMQLHERFGISEHELKDAIKPLFLLMHERGVTNLSIVCDGSKAVISVE